MLQTAWPLYLPICVLNAAFDPKHLGAAIGFLAVLHTWGQNLHLHPHIHCVVSGGGISPDNSRWIACRNWFFLDVKVLSRLFRYRFLMHLRKGSGRVSSTSRAN